MSSTVEVANISVRVHHSLMGSLALHIEGSGPFLQRPLWLNDWLRTNLLAFVFVGVHLGYFLAAVRVVWRFRHELRASSSFTVTGHSLGGATAEVAAVLAGVFLRVASCGISYGGPRPWGIVTYPVWWLAARLAGVEITWVRAGRDPVPMLPPWNLHLGRRHIVPTRLTTIVEDHVSGYHQFINRTL